MERSPAVARTAALTGARLVLLAGPTALAFFSGGYFETQEAVAGLCAWALVAVAAVACPGGLPRALSAWLALAGLALLGAWTLVSMAWAPITGNAYRAGQTTLLYTGTLLAAAMLLRARAAQRALEPALAAGTLIVVGYGISGRLLPGVLHFSRSLSARGRLEQPLTYWNAMGEVAAIGLVLCARLAGDASRPVRLRALAAAACAPLGMGLYVTFSRGAVFACAAGVVALLVAAPRREQLHATVVAVAAGGLGAIVAAPFGGVTLLAGAPATRERQGAIVLAALAAIAVAVALAQRWLAGRERTGDLRLPRWSPLIALGLICAGLALAIVVGAKETAGGASLSSGATRFVTLESNRYAYWRVALRAFSAQPLHGVGGGGWAVYWLRDRPFNEYAQDAHSLPLQTLAELGLVGVGLLAAFLAGVASAARAAHRVAPGFAAGPIAGVVVYVAHAPLDWDWQMPAVTLIAIVLAGGLLALAERARSQSDSAIRGASRLNTQTARTQTVT